MKTEATRLARRVLTALVLVLTLSATLASCADTDDADALGLHAFRPGAATTLTVAALPGYTDAATPPAGADTRAFDPNAPIGIVDHGKTDWAEGDSLAIIITFYEGENATGINFALAYTYATYTGTAWTLGDGLTTIGDPANLPGAVSGGKVLWPARAKSMVVSAVYAPGQTFGTDGGLYATTPAAAGRGEQWAATTTTVRTPGAPIVLGGWSARCVRLRVAAAPGDVVRITAPGFLPTGGRRLGDPATATDPGVLTALTATADAQGNAYFYGSGAADVTLTASFTHSDLYDDVVVPVFKTTKTFRYSNQGGGGTPGAGRSYAINALAGTKLDGVRDWSWYAPGKSYYYGPLSGLNTTTEVWAITDEAPDYAVLRTKLGEVAAADANRRVNLSLLKATSVGSWVFSNAVLATASLPAATSIGEGAFSGSTNLTTVSLPVATDIGSNAFNGCTALTGIELPAATGVGSSAFNNCTSLTGIELPVATSIGDYAFDGCKTLQTLSLPEAAISIVDNMFQGYKALTTVYAPKATSVGNLAFWNCTSLNAVTLTAAKSVGYQAFLNCATLKTVTLTAAKSVGNRAFLNCATLKTVTLTAADSIGNSAFNGCKTLADISLPAATSIKSSAFSGCTSLAGISLPAAKSIGGSAFSGCTSLDTLSLPKAESIGNGAFYNCTSLTALTFGTPIETWGKAVLGGTTNPAKPANITLILAPGQKAMTYDAAAETFKPTTTAFTDFGKGKVFCGGDGDPANVYTFGEIKAAGQ